MVFDILLENDVRLSLEKLLVDTWVACNAGVFWASARFRIRSPSSIW